MKKITKDSILDMLSLIKSINFSNSNNLLEDNLENAYYVLKKYATYFINMDDYRHNMLKLWDDESLDDLYQAFLYFHNIFPNWGYKIGKCHLSLDAFIFPDFGNKFAYEELAKNFDENIKWSEETKVSLIPNNTIIAYTFYLSIIKAIEIILKKELKNYEF